MIRTRRTRGARSDRFILLACVLPAMAAVLLLQIVPLAEASSLSFQTWNMQRSPSPDGVLTLASYERVLADPVFWGAVRTSAVITGASVALQLVFGTAIAYLLRPGGRARGVARALLLLPMVIAPVAAANMWRLMFNSQSGPVNATLDAIGLRGPEWLADPFWATVAVIVVETWQWTPFVMLVMSGALLAIPRELTEAAEVDGASWWQRFVRIELPLMVGSLALVATFRILDSLLQLDTVYALTQGGPGYSTYTITYYLYALGLRSFEISQSAAGSWLFMIAVAGIIIGMFRITATDRSSR